MHAPVRRDIHALPDQPGSLRLEAQAARQTDRAPAADDPVPGQLLQAGEGVRDAHNLPGPERAACSGCYQAVGGHLAARDAAEDSKRAGSERSVPFSAAAPAAAAGRLTGRHSAHSGRKRRGPQELQRPGPKQLGELRARGGHHLLVGKLDGLHFEDGQVSPDIEHDLLKRMVFLADGAKWIWDRFVEIAPEHSTFILDFYHACEHVSDVCKHLYGEQTPEYWKRFRSWKAMLFDGNVVRFLQELHTIRDAVQHKQNRNFIQGETNYFEQNKERMHYDRYRAMRLPIGSGTIESACKNVIGGRMKQGGMTWSEAGAHGTLQIRSSIESGRHLQDFLATLDRAA